MEITYIGHSGFLVETERNNYLFDYYRGEIPKVQTDKPLYVFASHKHPDHFNPMIFDLAKEYMKVTFVLSYDIKVNSFHMGKWGIGEEITNRILSVKANASYEQDGFVLQTLKSTDAGVAFLLKTEEGILYHAGDLNWWYWEEATKQENNNMTANFKREIEKLADISIDVAFVPLDPRLGKYYYLGMEYLMQKARCRYVFPMHCFDDHQVGKRFLEEGHGEGCFGKVMEIEKEGQRFQI